MPIKEVVELVRRKAGSRTFSCAWVSFAFRCSLLFPGVAVHTDAAQSIGKVRVRVDELGVDMLSVCAHKLYAPKGYRPCACVRVACCHLGSHHLGPQGVGALYIRRGIELKKLLHGAEHEAGRRAGTEVPQLGGSLNNISASLLIYILGEGSRILYLCQDSLQHVRSVCAILRETTNICNTCAIAFKPVWWNPAIP